ncbi:nucleotidyl transferase AbiEii/AbiGii toxin family protein [Thiohalocapsa marina]|uniref:nucleotidyl transferase AbiEii/AbiGii toxin family protein n=1 Tax=Thiohalocapsa marina TaxID=424902 RepID=UPI0036DEE52F
MTALKTELLPEATVSVIDKLADEAALSGFCLVGGTAMALWAGHRRSLDVDLVTFEKALDKHGLFQAMQARGATLVTPASMISAAKINGLDLLAHVQDYVLDGVKVQCFADPEGKRFAAGVQSQPGWRFGLADLPTMFAMKSALLLKRSRSRDYFDLMWFCQHRGKTLADIVAAARAADDGPEVPVLVEHKLLGLLPLDADDEGLDPVDVGITLATIHAYFEEQVQTREIAQARALIERRQETQSDPSGAS